MEAKNLTAVSNCGIYKDLGKRSGEWEGIP